MSAGSCDDDWVTEPDFVVRFTFFKCFDYFRMMLQKKSNDGDLKLL